VLPGSLCLRTDADLAVLQLRFGSSGFKPPLERFTELLRNYFRVEHRR
jgi:hypothetical protein